MPSRLPGMNFMPGSKKRGKVEKMEPKKRRLVMLFLFQQIVLLCMLFQLQGILFLCTAYIKTQTVTFATSLTCKKRFILRKMKQVRARQLRKKHRSCWFREGRTDQWWDNMMKNILPEEQWKKNFRMSRLSFFKLLEELKSFITPNPASPNHRCITAEKKLGITLWCSCNDSFKSNT